MYILNPYYVESFHYIIYYPKSNRWAHDKCISLPKKICFVRLSETLQIGE